MQQGINKVPIFLVPMRLSMPLSQWQTDRFAQSLVYRIQHRVAEWQITPDVVALYYVQVIKVLLLND